MAQETLLRYFDRFRESTAEFLVYDDGYRSRSHTYAEVACAAEAFAARLRAAGLGKGDPVLFWGENRPEWIAALWGCLLRGVVAVPIDYRASAAFVRRIGQIVGGRVLLTGAEVDLPADEGWPTVWRLGDIEWPVEATDPAAAGREDLSPDDLVEIVFTSGATAEPKGVQITHRNVLANIRPVEREIEKYRRYARPFRPIRFLNLLPLSHMFGQAMATFIPPLLPGVVVFMRGYNPAEIVRQIRTRRISVLVCVPKILDVLRAHVERHLPSAKSPANGSHWLRRWWRHRDAHRMFGWKFWSYVVGAAPLDPSAEEFWARLGFLVVQGYGLTETAPIVTLNHPFRARRGSVGSPIAGVEVKISPEGEILVRGENVSRGYYNAPRETAEAFEGGWFHTGDVGELDEAGRLLIRGRLKEMIVTPEGLNVFPDDVERVLNEMPGVVDSAVVGVPSNGEERVHAVLVLQEGVDVHDVVREANGRLEDHQRIRSAARWPQSELPRTEGTRKLKRREIRAWLTGERAAESARPPGTDPVEEIVGRYAGGRAMTAGTALDELGLSSLERMELMIALEERFQVTLDESQFGDARTVQDLRGLVERAAGLAQPGERPAAGTEPAGRRPAPGTPPAAGAEAIAFPGWNRTTPAYVLRRLSLPTWILPLQRIFTDISVRGLEHLRAIDGPVVFASNHQSHMDTPVILLALPPQWRYRTAPAMAKEFFKAHFFPAQHSRRAYLTNSLNYYLASLFFNAFPLPQREAGTRQTLQYIGDLLDEGISILIFPEGKRTEAGEINPFRPGIGMIGARLNVPVVPVRLKGLERVLHQSWRWPARGPVEVAFGAPLRLRGEDYAALSRQVEDAVRNL